MIFARRNLQIYPGFCCLFARGIVQLWLGLWSLRGSEQASPGFMELAFRLGTWLLGGLTERVCGAGLERGGNWRALS